MSQFEAYADAIAQEALMEMAENFFGERVSIDDEKERFCAQADYLRERMQDVLKRAGLLHALLFTDENIHDFYFQLDVRPGPYFLWVDSSHPRRWFPVPFALSSKERYVRLLLKTYELVQQEFDAYMNGFYHKASSGEKRLSMHYKLLMDWSGHINRRIRKVNKGLAPSCVLGLAHSIDVEGVDKERVTGATLDNYCCTLDQSLEIPPVSCHEKGIKPLPELPPFKDVQKKLTAFAKQVYKDHTTEAKALVQRLRH